VTPKPELALLDSAKYLYLQELTEPRDNSLRVVVQEAVENPAGGIHAHPELPEVKELFTEVSRIESTANCRAFELTWKSYVAYLVTEELVGSCGNYDDESFSGRLFRTYKKSHFLDHLRRDTGGHTAEINHYKVICLNHLIDIAAYEEPQIKQIDLSHSVEPNPAIANFTRARIRRSGSI
jgi:hypothetical protein